MRRGITFVPILFIILILSVIVIVSSFFVASQSNLATKKYYASKAFYIANAGFEFYLKDLKADADWSSPPAPPTKGFDGGCFVVSTSNATANQITVIAKGIFTVEATTYSRQLTATLNKYPGGLDAILADYVIYLGGASDEAAGTQLGENVVINGDMFINGGLTLGNGVDVSGDAYATGTISGSTAGITGTNEANVDMPADPPYLDQTYYNGEIATANAQTASNPNYNNTSITGNIYVKGNVTLSGTVNITNSAKIVCTGTLTVNNNATIGNNLFVIAQGTISFGNSAFVGNQNIWYSTTGIVLGNSADVGGVTAGQGSAFITPGNITMGNSCDIDGLIFAEGSLTAGNSNSISGNVIAHQVSQVGNDTQFNLNPGLVDIHSIPGIMGGGTVGAHTDITNWDETYP